MRKNFLVTIICTVIAFCSSASSYLGENAIWRCREGLVFHLLDEKGDGFNLSIDIRDMNTYLQGPREVLIFISGPNGNILVKRVVPDDGIIKGNFKYKDGVADLWQDIRYREFYRFNSSSGKPPGKQRQPLLKNPSKIPKRTIKIKVPPAGKGIYRLLFVASMDHFISVTPDRELSAAIHPGPGPLYIPERLLDEAYIYSPAMTKDIAFMIHEETMPFSYSATIKDEKGNIVAKIIPKGRFNYNIIKNAEKDSIYEINIAHGKEPGGYLHVMGVPMLLCPDRETAKKMRGGLIDIDRNGNYIFHGFQKVMADWAYSLKKDDFAVNAKGNKELANILAAQDLNPNSKTYGTFPRINKIFPKRFNVWKQPADYLSKLVSNKNSDNNFYGNKTIIRRIALNRIMKYLLTQTVYFWYGGKKEKARSFPKKINVIWDLGFRSNWYPLEDALHAKTFGFIKDFAPYTLPAKVINAWKNSFRSWVICRTVMQQGECSNQWGKGLQHMNTIYKATRDYSVEEVLKRQIKRFTTPGILGRSSPDITPYTHKSKVAIDNLACDTGVMGGGVAADGMGHDGEYCLETTAHLDNVWQVFRDSSIEKFLNEYYFLKTHLTVPKGGSVPSNSFSGTIHPTDSNFRTRCYTHKSPLCDDLRAKLDYGPLWKSPKSNKTWPCLEDGSFVRSVDKRFYFVKTPTYYAIIYGGPAAHSYVNWDNISVNDGHIDLTGFGGMYYGGYGRKATKIGTISALWVKGCGPTMITQNHNVNYTNALWGRVKKPISKSWQENHVDPYIVSSSYAQAEFEFDEKNRSFTKTQIMEYAPLKLVSKVKFNDNDITVNVQIEALDNVDFKELYFAIPYFAQNRRIFLYTGAKKEKFNIPKYFVAKTSRSYKNKLMSGENPKLSKVSFDALSILALNNDSGSKIIFPKKYNAIQSHPLKYRNVAAALGAFNLVLPAKWQKGKIYNINYKIINGEI